MNDFVIFALLVAFYKFIEFIFQFYQIKVQADIEKLRIRNEHRPEENDEERHIGFNAYGNTMTQVEE